MLDEFIFIDLGKLFRFWKNRFTIEVGYPKNKVLSNLMFNDVILVFQDLGAKLRQKKDNVDKQAEFKRWYEDIKRQLNNLAEDLNDEGDDIGKEIAAWKSKGDAKMISELEQRWMEIRCVRLFLGLRLFCPLIWSLLFEN